MMTSVLCLYASIVQDNNVVRFLCKMGVHIANIYTDGKHDRSIHVGLFFLSYEHVYSSKK